MQESIADRPEADEILERRERDEDAIDESVGEK